jgi:hypothetical protein
MQKISTIVELRYEIAQLQIKQSLQAQSVKEQFKNVRESLRPVNLIKSTFKEAIGSPDLMTNVLNAGVGLAAGIITKKMFVGSTHNPFKRILGTILEAGMATIVATKGDSIRDSAIHLFKNVFTKKPVKDQDDD